MKITPGAPVVELVVSWLAWWPEDPSKSFSAALCSLPPWAEGWFKHFWPLGWSVGLMLVGRGNANRLLKDTSNDRSCLYWWKSLLQGYFVVGFSWMRENSFFFFFWAGIAQTAPAMSGVTRLMLCYSLLAIMDQVIAVLGFGGFGTDTKTLHMPDWSPGIREITGLENGLDWKGP